MLEPLKILEEEWKNIDIGIKTSKHDYHSFVLSTIRSKSPNSRTVILRAFDVTGPSMWFHTDKRSKKVLKVVFFKLSNLDLPIKYLVFGYFKHININQLHPTQDLPPPAAPPNKTSVVVLSNRYSIACSCVCVKLASMFNSFDIYINLNRIIPRT